jgi:hypothetical protein
MAPIPADNFRHVIKRRSGEPNLGDGTREYLKVSLVRLCAAPHGTWSLFESLLTTMPAALISAAVPLKEAGTTLDIIVSMGVSVPGALSKPDSFTVTTASDNKPFAGGVQVVGKRMTDTLFLEDGNGKELARIFKSGGKMGKSATYEICGYKPFVEGQLSKQQQPGQDGRELFSWAKVSGDGFGSLKLHVQMYHGPEQYVETYFSEPNLPEGGYKALKGIYPPVIFKKTDGTYVAFVSERKASNPLAGLSWLAHIAPGMDPCLVICCIAILDEYEKKRHG